MGFRSSISKPALAVTLAVQPNLLTMLSSKIIPTFLTFLVLILFSTIFYGCPNAKDAPPVEIPTSKPTSNITNDTIPLFDGQAAYSLVEKQLNFGARVPGSKAHTLCRDFLLSELRQLTDTAFLQSFTSEIYGKQIRFSNIIGSYNPKSVKRILLCAHWDSRPRSDQSTNPSDTASPCPAANDGASGVAVLLEIAHKLREKTPTLGIDIVLFDGEDYGYEHDLSNYFIGSRHFAGNLPFSKPMSAVLLDLVGDKDAEFRFEPSSYNSNPTAINKIWDIAARRGCGYFKAEQGNGVSDDHDMLIQASIPSIDIIDVNLVGHVDKNPRRKYWHTIHDTIENISPETLQCVGQCVLEYVYTF
ncbi:MAG: M28 family peptidase [Ignavibacteria bacterium]|nr:M28 family peptidase [Ignavibacteria bacterium]